MAKSLAELRSAPPTERRTGSVRLCLRPDLVSRVQELTGELAELSEPEFTRPRKMMESAPPEHPRAIEIKGELDGVLAEIEDHEGEVVVRANLDDGEWRRWVDAHPPRPEGEPGHDRDRRITGGLANADALIDTLGTFAYTWNSEPLAEGDWASVFEPVVSTGDKAEMARTVVTLYEGRTDFRQWRSALSTGLRKLGDSASPGPSESATSGSTDGNPAPSSEATTGKVTRSRSRTPGK
jgi:hypothetical protein